MCQRLNGPANILFGNTGIFPEKKQKSAQTQAKLDNFSRRVL
jgi:hypothetical protein